MSKILNPTTSFNPNRKYFKDKQIAELLGVGVSTLRNQRQRGEGLPYRKFGRTVLYDINEVMEYIEQHRVDPR